MSCNHKFQNELLLEHIDYEPATLIVGTFSPGSPVVNPAEWFYGRAGNYFWDILPRLYGEDSLINAAPADWKRFCRDKQIALTDLISSIDDAGPEHNKILGGFSDQAIAYNFDDFGFVDITKILQRLPTITSVYLTRGVTEVFWRHLWNPVALYCSRHGIRERKLITPTTDNIDHQVAYNNHTPGHRVPLLQDYFLMRWQQEWHF